MHSLDDALAFANEYIDTMYKIAIAQSSETDDPVAAANHHKLVAPGAYDGTDGRASRPDANGGWVPWIAPRKIFLITQHNSTKLGAVFACTLSDNTPDGDTYYTRIFVAPVDGDLKLIAKSLSCWECKTTGKLAATATRYLKTGRWKAGDRCPECKGSGWVKLPGGWGAKEGLNASKPGKIIDVRKLLPPTDPDHLAHFNSL